LRPRTDEQPVGARTTAAAIPRVIVVVAAGLFATATITFAAGTALQPRSSQHKRPASATHVLVVPDVRRQVFVFAKGMLEDEGLGWEVKGSVRGYAPNVVASQSPAPRTRVIDTGAPKITLELSRNAKYAEVGTPEDRSPYGASVVRVFGRRSVKLGPKAARARATRHANARAAHRLRARRPAFFVPGAPREPLREMSLPVRARRLGTWLERHRTPTEANVHHWLYQHAWIVAGSKFGWSGGAQAVAILVKVDRRAEHLWGIGSHSRQIALRTLRSVRARSR
jgi:hypothetical protein